MKEMNELDFAWENARSVRKGINKGKYIGTIEKGDYSYLFYKDEAGNYWYESRRRSE